MDLTKIDCLVGNGELDKDYSHTIDSYSCVARINTLDGLGHNRGNKTDILFISSCSNKTLKNSVHNFNPTIHVSPLGRDRCICNNKLPLLDLHLKTDRISSGTRIIHFLDGKVSSLSIFGFNWRQKSKSFYHEYSGKGVHDWDKEMELCLSIIEKNNWRLYV